MTKTIHLDDHLRRREGVEIRGVEGSTVLFNLEMGEYFGLEGVGLDIWRGIEEGLSVCEVAKSLVQSYDVSLPECQNDVMQFARRLCRAGLLEVVENQR